MATAANATLTSVTKLRAALGSAEFLSDGFTAELAAELNALELVKVATNSPVLVAGSAIAHGLGRAPNSIVIVPRAGNVVFLVSADATNVNLQAVTATTNVDLYVS